MVDAEAFYQAMPKPDAPNDCMLAQSRLVVTPAPPNAPRGPDEAEAAARRFYGHQEAQDSVQPAAGNIVARSQRLLLRLLTRPSASMSSAGSKRRIGLSVCSAKRRWTACATTRWS